MAKKLPLEGIRILDYTIIWAGPVASLAMSDLGAETIRIESIHYLHGGLRGGFGLTREQEREDPTALHYPLRSAGPRGFNRRLDYNWFGRNQRSMTVDLTRPEGKEIFHQLVKISDGFISNPAMRSIDRLGMTYEELSQVNPRIIVAHMPMFGCTGPYKYKVGMAMGFDGFLGHGVLRAYPGEGPDSTTIGVHGDAAGITLAQAFITALIYRNRTGKGQFIDIAQAEAAVHHFAPAYLDYFANDRIQGPLANRDTSMAPQGCYRCYPPGGDNWVVISVENDAQWQTLCQLMRRSALANDPRFADAISRYKNQDEIDPIISNWTGDLYPMAVTVICQKEGIPAAPVSQDEQVLADSHLHARDFFEKITHPEAGTHFYPGYPYKLSETPLPHPRHAPILGQDNEYVYKELLGYSDAEYQRLIDEKHIGWAYLPTASV